MEKESNSTQMRTAKRKTVILLAFALVCWAPGFLSSETLTMTTYYPAPYGGYTSILTTGLTLLARDGNSVGIGTPMPGAKLDIKGSGNTAATLGFGMRNSDNIAIMVVRDDGNVGIGSTSPQAKLEIQSTTSGFLPPRMSQAQRDAMGFPPEGSVIYNLTANQIEYWDGNSWNGMSSGSRFMGATTAVYNGAEVVGYAGGDAKCNSQYVGSRMCTPSVFASARPSVAGWYSTYHHGGGPYYVVDCEGWTDSWGGKYGSFWNGSRPSIEVCADKYHLLCCK